MLVSTKTLIACFAPLALAQYGPPAGGGGSSSSSSSAPPKASTTGSTSASTTASSTPGVQTVVVGADSALTFNPNSTTAAVGTTIEFQFPGTAVHSVVEGSFADPCVPANGSAFFSGGLSSTTNVFTITINDTNPIWYFCGFPGHCGLGMVGVINPPSTQTVAEFAAAAAKVSNAPTITLPVEGGTVGPAKAASTPASSSSSTTSAAATSSTAKSVAARGMETGGSTQWVVVALTGMAALCVGSLIM